MAAPTAFGTSFQISTQNVNLQDGSAVAVLRDGRIAVVWKDVGTNTGDIKLQIVQSDGTLAGSESTVNVTIAGQQTEPAITALAGGGFVIGWTTFASDAFGDVAYRTFRANGNPVQTADGVVTAAAGYQQDISLVALTGDQFAIGWNDGNTATTGLGSSTAAMLRTFDGTGALAPDLRLSGNAGGDWGPVLAFDGAQLLAAWDDSGSDGIFTRTLTGPLPATDFTDTGARVDPGPSRESSNDPDVALTGAGPVIVWDDVVSGTLGRDIFVSQNGTVSRVNTSTTGDQSEAAVCALDTGGFVVVWTDLNGAGGSDIRARVFDEAGLPTSADFLVTEAGLPSAGVQYSPDVASLIDGRFLVTWSDATAGRGIDGRIFDPRTEAILFFGTGDDERVYGTSFNDTLAGYGGNDTLIASGGDDALQPGAGKNTLDGGAGRDTADYADTNGSLDITLKGSSFATVRINGADTDRIRNIETIWGGASDDRIIGDNRANALLGHGGGDLLNGGLGTDTLTGGTGGDLFQFSTAADKSNRDQISDFETGFDQIRLKKSIFSALGNTIDSDELLVGTAALDANDHLIFNATTLVLSYDADGNGGARAQAILQLQPGATLDFLDLSLF
jgi:Ca2+-binding RTX toxin-like protein